MSRVPQSVVNPNDPQSVVEHLYRVQRVVDGRIEFGNAQDPANPASSSQANGINHNGTILNIDGSWVAVPIIAAGRTTVTCIHNLYDSTFTPTPNLVPVRWLQMGWRHSGASGDATTQVDMDIWYMGGTVLFDRIDLAVTAQVVVPGIPPFTISGITPMILDLFFIRATR